MKYHKPGFGVFIRTRIKHPLKSQHKLIFTDAEGIRQPYHYTVDLAKGTAIKRPE